MFYLFLVFIFFQLLPCLEIHLKIFDTLKYSKI